MQRPVFVVALIGLVLAIVVVVVAVYLVGSGAQVRQAIGERTHEPAPDAAKGEYRSVGERIYMTAVGTDGKRIAFTDGAPWLSTQGGSCVNCHGPDGRGGEPVMPTAIMAPDIRYSALTGQEAEASHVVFTDFTIKRAITRGLDEEGKPLDPTMPRWKMSDKDLDAILAYLKELDKSG